MSDELRSEDLIIKELNFIQDVIKRMASNSFLIKGWTITLIVVALIFKGSENHVYVAFIPLISFWILDAYYLRQERLYRKLFEWVRENRRDSEEYLYDLNTSRFGKNVQPICRTMISITLIYFYGSILVLLLLYMLLTKSIIIPL